MNNISFQSVHFKASTHLEEFVTVKLSKILDQDSSIIRADVTLFEGASGNPRNRFCEIELSVPGDNLFIKKNSENYEKSILAAVTALQQIIHRKKKKHINKLKKHRETQ
ncbi:MAG: HPF/RaiA family ribosome-associated protein [Bacteroidales bacterium]|nr:HPF/RaiA family ribosome-associated protein [Bacteroidales bacterium]